MIRLETCRPLEAVAVNAVRILGKDYLVYLLVPELIIGIGVAPPR